MTTEKDIKDQRCWYNLTSQMFLWFICFFLKKKLPMSDNQELINMFTCAFASAIYGKP